ncbi:hypothetical protein M3Y96_01232900 [Aphelenchoides besseyi]|nr:hypothetical protein M3Y96_01232900 [Aphelenchoides besseyi]
MTSVLSTIEKIREETRFRPAFVQASNLRNHQLELDIVDRKIYINVEVHPDCLDNGSDVTETSRLFVWQHGVVPDDEPHQIIGKQLGGSGHVCNVIPLNEKVKLKL